MQIRHFPFYSNIQSIKCYLSYNQSRSLLFFKYFSTLKSYPIYSRKFKLKRLHANALQIEDLRLFSSSPSLLSQTTATPIPSSSHGSTFSRLDSCVSSCVSSSTKDGWYSYFDEVLKDEHYSTNEKFQLLGKLASLYPSLPSIKEFTSLKKEIISNPSDPSTWLTKITVADIYLPFSSETLSTSFLSFFCKLSAMDSDWSFLHHFLNLLYPTSYSLSSSSSSLSFFHDHFALLVHHAPELALEWFYFLLTDTPLIDARIYSLLAILCFKVNNKTPILIYPLETYVLNYPCLYPNVIPSIAETWIRLFEWDHALSLLERYTCLKTNIKAIQTYLIYLDFKAVGHSEIAKVASNSNCTSELIDFVIRVSLKTPSIYRFSLFLYLDVLEFDYVPLSIETLLQVLSKAPMIPGFPCESLFFILHFQKKVPYPSCIAIAWLRYICACDIAFLPTFLQTMHAQRWYFSDQDAWRAFKLLKFYHRPAIEYFWLLHLIHPLPPLKFKETCFKKIIAFKEWTLTQLYLPYIELTNDIAHAILSVFPPFQSLPLLLQVSSTSSSSSFLSSTLEEKDDESLLPSLLSWTASNAPALFVGLLQSSSVPITEDHVRYCILAMAKLNRSSEVDLLFHYAPMPLSLPLRLTTIQAYCQLRQPCKAFPLLEMLPMKDFPELWLDYFQCLIVTHRFDEFQSLLEKDTCTVFASQPTHHWMALLHLIMRMWIQTNQEHQLLQMLPQLPSWFPETILLLLHAYKVHLAQPHSNPTFLSTLFQYFEKAIHQGVFRPIHWKELVPLLLQFHRWQELTQLLTLVPTSPILNKQLVSKPYHAIHVSPPYDIKLLIHSKVEARLTYLNQRSTSTFLSSSSTTTTTTTTTSSSSTHSFDTQSEIRSMKRLVQAMEHVSWKR